MSKRQKKSSRKTMLSRRENRNAVAYRAAAYDQDIKALKMSARSAMALAMAGITGI